jgi:hypothetical protein
MLNILGEGGVVMKVVWFEDARRLEDNKPTLKEMKKIQKKRRNQTC